MSPNLTLTGFAANLTAETIGNIVGGAHPRGWPALAAILPVLLGIVVFGCAHRLVDGVRNVTIRTLIEAVEQNTLRPGPTRSVS